MSTILSVCYSNAKIHRELDILEIVFEKCVGIGALFCDLKQFVHVKKPAMFGCNTNSF